MNKFACGECIQHVKSKSLYVIEDIPPNNRLEASDEPAYGYRSLETKVKWQRSQTEIEDGRFVAWDRSSSCPASESPFMKNCEVWYNTFLPEALSQGKQGQWGLVFDEKVYCFKPTQRESMDVGYAVRGLDPFCVMHVDQEQLDFYKASRGEEQPSCGTQSI